MSMSVLVEGVPAYAARKALQRWTQLSNVKDQLLGKGCACIHMPLACHMHATIF